jgi:alkanesulfonate monooxygenase SsuD/methylene tetrahydromethanopterin reductase-like flavin-dependent oxidoreductase (luciferase family)
MDDDDDNNNARATFHGKFYKLDGAQTGPRPFHPIRIGLVRMDQEC